jgi:hypothetical protein
MKLKRSQAAVELLVILAVGLTVILAVLTVSNNLVTGTGGRIEKTKSRAAVDSLSDAAELVYQQGVGSRTRVFVTLPDQITGFTASGQTLYMQLHAGGELADAYRNLDFNISGELPAEAGNYWLYVEAKEGYVQISQNITVEMDGTPPEISNVRNGTVTNQSAVILWDTDENSDSAVYYGPTQSFGSGKTDSLQTTSHSSTLTGLTDDTMYYYKAGSCDLSGNCVNSSTYNFTTLQNAGDTAPPSYVTGLENQSAGTAWIYWNWTNPSDSDFNHTEVWVNDTFYANVSTPTNSYNATGLSASKTYQIQTRTADHSNNINTTWANDTATTPATQPQNTTVFHDGFEAWGSNNCEHNGLWDACSAGDGNLRQNNGPYNGTWALRFDDHDADSDYLIKCVDLSTYSRAYVSFWWKKSGLDSGEYGKLDINKTGSGYSNIFSSGTGTSSYAEAVIDITGNISSNTCIKFHILANLGSDRFFIDAATIIGET